MPALETAISNINSLGGVRYSKAYKAAFFTRSGVEGAISLNVNREFVLLDPLFIYNSRLLDIGLSASEAPPKTSVLKRVSNGNFIDLFYIRHRMASVQCELDQVRAKFELIMQEMVAAASDMESVYAEALSESAIILRERRTHQSGIFQILAACAIDARQYESAVSYCDQYYQFRNISRNLGASIVRDLQKYASSLQGDQQTG